MASKRSLTSAARPASHVRVATMKAIVQHRYGAPDVLAFEEIERPRAGYQDVLIRVHPAGVSYPDGVIASGIPSILRLVAGLSRPKTRHPGDRGSRHGRRGRGGSKVGRPGDVGPC